MSNTILLTKAHTKPQKIKLLNRLTENEKQTVIKELKAKIETNWDSCDIETNNRLSKKFSNKNDEILHLDSLLQFSDWTFNKYIYGTRSQKRIYQYDIFYCDLGSNIGSEKNKTRPVIIIQKTKGYLNAQTLVIAPITIGENFDKVYDHEVIIDHTEKSKIKGKIDLSHMRSIDRSRLDEYYSDRLLKKEEYKKIYNDNHFVMTQDKIKTSLKKLMDLN